MSRQTNILSLGGVGIFIIEANRQDPLRIIGNHLDMTRQTVFKINNKRMDVFHG